MSDSRSFGENVTFWVTFFTAFLLYLKRITPKRKKKKKRKPKIR